MPRKTAEPTRRGLSLEHRIPLLIAGLLIGLLSITLALAYQEVYRSSLVAGREQLGRFATQLRDLLQSGANGRLALLAQAAREVEVRAMLSEGNGAPIESLDAVLAGLRAEGDSLPVELWSSVVGPPIHSLPSAFVPPRELADFGPAGGFSSWFEDRGRVYQFVAAPVMEGTRTLGYLVQVRAFGNPDIAEQIEELLSSAASVYLVDGKGNWAGLDGQLRRVPEVAVTSGLVEYTIAEERYFAHAEAVTGTPYSVVVEHPASVVLARPAAFLRSSAILFLGMISLGAAGAWVVGRRLTAPIRELSTAAEALAAGDYAQRVPEGRPDELGMLAQSFNAMAGEVQTAHADLKRQVAQASTLTRELEATNARLQEMMDSAAEAQLSAEQASRAKSDFLATVSHELRTPINAIIGYTDLLSLGIPDPPGPHQLEHLDRLRRSGRHLTRLIDDLLDLAKIEAGQLHTNEAEESAEQAMEAAMAIVGPLAGDKGVEVLWDRGGHDTRYVGDSRRVEQILVNLLGNAVKFTPSGGTVRLTACGVEDADDPRAGDQPMVAVTVEDTGIGVPPDKREAIFDRFVQGESGFRRSHEGAGLGLAISRELARRMGGDITVESAGERGSRFTLLLPAGRSVRQLPQSAPVAQR